MSRAIVYNDLERIQRSRTSRMPARVDGIMVAKSVAVLGLILFYALLYIQLQVKSTQTSSNLAAAQQEFLRLQNVQKNLVQQIAGLKEPARIQRLALAMGMVPPQDKRLAEVFSAPWDSDVKLVSNIKQVNATAGREKLSLLSKLLAFGPQAEAKGANQ